MEIVNRIGWLVGYLFS